MSKVLYISYDGILEPLGYSQVWSYLAKLSDENSLVLLSFEKKSDELNKSKFIEMKKECQKYGVNWIPLRYHKSPTSIATTYDILSGLLVAFFYTLRYRIEIVHTRSYVPALIGLLIKLFLNRKFIFDMRGLWADEKVDSKVWSREGLLYKITKKLEKQFLLNADVVVSLTQSAVDEIKRFNYLQDKKTNFEVITTCADLDVFSINQEDSQTISPFTLGYVGSIGLWYAFKETLLCFKLLQNQIQDSRLVIVNKGQHQQIQDFIQESDIDPSSVDIFSTDHYGVAKAMNSMNAGVFFINPFYSKVASAPTKLGEFLGCGVPCLSNDGIGDMTRVLETNKVGVSIKDFHENSLQEGVIRLIKLSKEENIQMKCRKIALEYFSLEKGVNNFKRIYKSLENA